MTPEQRERTKLLKTRNIRRLQQPAIENGLRELGFNPILVADDRCERLNARLAAYFHSDRLEEHSDWPELVAQFAAGCFGLTITDLWDWDGDTPMYRVAAKTIEKHPERLGQVFLSGFALIDDEDRHSLMVDLDFDENEQKLIASLAEYELTNASN